MGDMTVMLVERRREDMAAIAIGDEVELVGIRRVQRRLDGRLAGMGDRPRWEARRDISVIRGIDGQIALGEYRFARTAGAEDAVDRRRIGLQLHTESQAVEEHRRDPA